MEKLLYVNGNIGKGSRTEKLSKKYIKNLVPDNFELEEVVVRDLDINSFDEKMIKNRDADIYHKDLYKSEYILARQFANAGYIIMSAPYWDCIFPAKFRAYLEHICVNTITFAHDEKGNAVKLCKAKKLIYITTSGGFIGENSAIETYIKELAKMFAIDEVKFYSAQGLDIFPDKVDEILKKALETMEF